MHFAALRQRTSLDRKLSLVDRASIRIGDVRHQRSRLHAGNRTKPPHDLFVEVQPRRWLRVLYFRQREVERQQRLRSVARIHAQQSLEAFHHQARAYEKHERERHFGNDQRSTQTVPCAADGSTAAAFFQRFRNAGARTQQGRRDPRDHPAEHRDNQREQKGIGVQTNRLPPGHESGYVRRHVRQNHLDIPLGQKQTESRACQGQHDALD